jgi:hypothetical protein
MSRPCASTNDELNELAGVPERLVTRLRDLQAL